MTALAPDFKANAAKAIADPELQRALANVKRGFVMKRAEAKARLPEFDTLRDEARAIKLHTLSHLDLYLDYYERKVGESGGHVHFAPTAEDAREIILELCRKADAKLVTKGKSMVSEEIGLNACLEGAGIEAVETDLGEYIAQMRKEAPSHLIAPIIHLNKETIAEDFRRSHQGLPADRTLASAADLVAEARAVLRQKFLAADVGITGANLLIAETGTSVVVTNEGNADLTQTLPKMHIVIASIEKLVPTLEDACTILRLLARSGTGQEITTYTTFSTGPRREGDADGPSAYHVVLLDNGRSEMLGGTFNDMLSCIRCGACLNHCPVYTTIGGHAYGSLYTGPMGAVLTPALGRDRSCARPAECFEPLRALRGCVPGAHSVAVDVTGLAGTRLRPRQSKFQGTSGAQALGLCREAATALSRTLGRDGQGACVLCRKVGKAEAAPLRRRLDAKPRPPCSARQDLPPTLREED